MSGGLYQVSQQILSSQEGLSKTGLSWLKTVFSDGLLYTQEDSDDPSRPYKAKKI